MQEKIKLDLIDKKILLSLMQNSRLPKTILARQLKISAQRLEYKLNRLYNSIIQPAIILNYKLLNIQEYFIFAETLSKESIKNLQKSQNIFFLAEFVGKYKYLIYVLTDDLSKFKTENIPEENVETYQVTDFQTDTYNPFNLELKQIKTKESQKQKLTKEDYKILYELYQNPIENYVNLSEKTSLDWRTIKTRIEKLLSSGTIDRFKIAFDPFKMGFLKYFIKITTPEIYKTKIKQITAKDNFSGFLFESHDEILLIYMPKSHEELLLFIKKLESISDKIKTDINQIVNFKVETKPEFILEEFKRRSN